MTTAYSKILGVLTITTGSLSRQAESFGICELLELKEWWYALYECKGRDKST